MKTAIKFVLVVACLAVFGCSEKPAPVAQDTSAVTPVASPAQTTAGKAVAFRVPAESEITDTITLASIRRGRALLRNTQDSLPHNVGARLN